MTEPLTSRVRARAVPAHAFLREVSEGPVEAASDEGAA
jgi:hypothetical protein